MTRELVTQAFAVDEVVPHQDLMSLLDRIVSYDVEQLIAEVDITADTLFAGDRGVPAWIGIEYMAQAIAAHAGVLRRLEGREVKVGFLVGTRKYQCSQPYFPLGSTLRVTVQREYQADNGLGAFNCTIETAKKNADIQASCTLNVFQPDNVEDYLAEEGVGSAG